MTVAPAFFSRSMNRFSAGGTTDATMIPDAIWRPKTLQARNPVIYMHGAGAATTATQVNQPETNGGQRKVAMKLVEAGFAVVATTAPNTWGNPTLQTRAEEAIAYARANLNAVGPVILFGASHGVACMLSYALQHMSDIACAVGLIPAVDPEDIRTFDRWGLRVEIDAAHGITYPTPLPANVSPSHATSMATLSALPMQFWYASNDTVTNAGRVENFAANTGAEIHNVGPLDHTQAALMATDEDAVLNFIETHV